MQKFTSLVSVRIRRDAHTATPVAVLAHELPILFELYGKENVAVDASIDDARELDANSEYQRLCNKYGSIIVEEVYGRESSGRLADAFTRVAATGSGEQDAPAQTAKRRGRRPASNEDTAAPTTESA